MSPKALLAGGAAVFAVWLWVRRAKADEPTPTPTPEPTPTPTPEPTPTPNKGDVGSDPLDVPTQGKFYRVRRGDTLSGIAYKAGLGGSSWRKIRDAVENAWLPKAYPDGRFFAGTDEPALPLYEWFAPPGYRVEPQYRTAPENLYPSIFIPKKA